MKKKISKKIVALLTMAAFVLTLLPVAAFAGNANTTYSHYTVTSDNAAKTLVVTLDLDSDSSGSAATLTNTAVKVSVTDAAGKLLSDDVADVSINCYGGGSADIAGVANNGFTLTTPQAGENTPLTLTYTGVPVGSYTVAVQIDVDTTDDTSFVSLMNESGQETTTVSYSSNAASAKDSFLLTRSATASLDAKKEVTVNPTNSLGFEFNVRDASGNESLLPLNAGTNDRVYLFALNEDGQLTNAVDFAAGTSDALEVIAKNSLVYKVVNPDASVTNGETVYATFNTSGTYTICAAVVTGADGLNTGINNGLTVDTVFGNTATIIGSVKVTVNPLTYVTKLFSLTGSAAGTMEATNDADGDGKATEFTYTLSDNVTPNGIKVYTVDGVAYEADGTIAPNENLSLSIGNQTGIQLLDTKIGTNDKGKFSFRFTLTKDGEYDIKIQEANGDVTGTLTVIQETVAPVDIETIKDGGRLLAATDIDYRNAVNFDSVDFFAGEVQFKITNVYGNTAWGESAIAKEEAASSDPAFIKVTAPEGSDLKASDLKLAWSESYGVYTIQYVGKDAIHDLTPGEYTVEVSLNNGNKDAATFTLAEFGDVEELVLGMTAVASNATNSQNNSIVPLSDQVALGQTVTVRPYYMDETGLRVPAVGADLIWGINGDAVSTRDYSTSPSYVTFTTAGNIAYNDSLLGTLINVTAVDKNTNKAADSELTVVKNYLEESLSFNPTQGDVERSNDVTVSIVDADGNVSRVNGTMYAYITDQSNADATIDLTVNENVRNGQGSLILRSDVAGTVDVRVVVQATNGEVYSATLTYTFGDEDPFAGTIVVMTIGSQEYIVNNEIVNGAADNLGAPYVNSDFRTMVPIRALAETFGADVNYEDGVITIVDGDTTIVMTVGEKTYTVNDADQTMDTAPVIGQGDRAYVPTRFVAEALGYTVTPLYDAVDNTTEAVHIQK